MTTPETPPQTNEGWQGIEGAPRDDVVLLYGKLRPHPDNEYLYADLDMICRCAGYWDQIDEAWCPVGSTWQGPWLEPTHWMPLPPAPTPEPRA